MVKDGGSAKETDHGVLLVRMVCIQLLVLQAQQGVRGDTHIHGRASQSLRSIDVAIGHRVFRLSVCKMRHIA